MSKKQGKKGRRVKPLPMPEGKKPVGVRMHTPVLNRRPKKG